MPGRLVPRERASPAPHARFPPNHLGENVLEPNLAMRPPRGVRGVCGFAGGNRFYTLRCRAITPPPSVFSPPLPCLPCFSAFQLQDSWEAEGYECVRYSQSTMVGCYCMDVIVTSIKDNGLIDGIKEVASEQGDVCASFLKGYAKANAVKTLAVSGGRFFLYALFYFGSVAAYVRAVLSI